MKVFGSFLSGIGVAIMLHREGNIRPWIGENIFDFIDPAAKSKTEEFSHRKGD